MSTLIVSTAVGALLVSVALTGIALPRMRFGEPLSNIALFVGPQVLAMLVVTFIPPRPRQSFLLGVLLATLAILVQFCLSVAREPPDNFMAVMAYWFSLGSAAAIALAVRRLLPLACSLQLNSVVLGFATFGLCLLGAKALTELLI